MSNMNIAWCLHANLINSTNPLQLKDLALPLKALLLKYACANDK